MWAFKRHSDEHGGNTDKSMENYTIDNENTQQAQEKTKIEWAEHFWGILNTNQNPTLTTIC